MNILRKSVGFKPFEPSAFKHTENCLNIEQSMNLSIEVEITAAKWRWSYLSDPLLITVYGLCLVVLGLRHRNNIKAVHILELNTLLDLTVGVICHGLQNFDFYLQGDLYCIIIHTIKQWAKFSFYADFSLGEIDKFLSLYWSYSYKVRVTNIRAKFLIVIVKFLLIPVTVTAAFLDTDYLRCSRHLIFVCSHFKPTNFFWTTIPMVICSSVTITVSIYTFRVARRIANNVTPVVNLPAIPTISASKHRHDIKRMSSEPYSFKRVEVPAPAPVPEIVPSCSIIIERTSDLLQTAKTAVKFNIICLCFIGLLIPENILNTWVFFSKISCENDPDFTARAQYVMLFELPCNLSLSHQAQTTKFFMN